MRPTWSDIRDYLRLAFAAIAILAVAIAVTYHWIQGQSGWDYKTYIAGVAALEAGANPYRMEVLQQFGGNYPYIYLPVVLVLLKPLVAPAAFVDYQLLLVLEYSVATLLSAFLLYRVFMQYSTEYTVGHIALLVAVVVAGFQGTYWNLYSGNIDLIGLLLFTGALWLAANEHRTLAGISVGVLALLKIFPVVLFGAFLLGPEPLRERLRMAGSMGSTVALGVLGSWLIRPDLFPTEWMAAVQSESPSVLGQGYVFQISTMYAIEDVIAMIGFSRWYGVSAWAILALTLLGATIWWLQREDDLCRRLAIGFALLLLAFPRLKPYYLVYAVPAVVLTTLPQLRQRWCLREAAILVFVIGIPSVGMLAYTFLGRGAVRDLHPLLLNTFRYAPLLGIWGWALFEGKIRLTNLNWLPSTESPLRRWR